MWTEQSIPAWKDHWNWHLGGEIKLSLGVPHCPSENDCASPSLQREFCTTQILQPRSLSRFGWFRAVLALQSVAICHPPANLRAVELAKPYEVIQKGQCSAPDEMHTANHTHRGFLSFPRSVCPNATLSPDDAHPHAHPGCSPKLCAPRAA